MAKVSARGAVKLAQATLVQTDDDKWEHKHRRVLRSDGVVLRAHSLRRPGESRWSEGGLSIVGKLPARARADGRAGMIEYFVRFYTDKGFATKIGG